MTDHEGLHVVLGASGGTGSAIVSELVGRGRRVRAVSRGGGAPDGAEGFRADVSTPEGARAASAGAAVVYHAAQPAYTRWREEFPPMTDAVIEGAARAGAKLVFADNLYMYGAGSPQPMTEKTPQRASGKKGRVRAIMAEGLLDAHRSGRVRAAIGRSSDYYGPGGTGTIAGETVFAAALNGKTVRWPASLDVPHQFNYLPDMARALVTLGESEEADGEVWHLPAEAPITGRRFLELVFAEAGRPAKTSVTSTTVLRFLGVFSPFLRELVETAYQFEEPFAADASKYRRVFGPFEATPHEEAVARTVAWFRGR
ncbi:NAD-dependent epimerase/dehydratase family protein [Rubrobacter marinus]|uniref:NAD-dependent epimerase/dehydratase family protein n=1 Tax=Rubrobacter marinus TaxID=2653852 RepID=A0A6G8PUC7_9ACTN|nr:NAD-dependent epimerase/dehydratase family protein [Rubrobacter marinus]QIN77315.1 NAD-dependent epimerase/dehydratase family protein [Rubrobacter marinus]